MSLLTACYSRSLFLSNNRIMTFSVCLTHISPLSSSITASLFHSRPVSQILLTTDSSPSSGLTSRTLDRTASSERIGLRFVMAALWNRAPPYGIGQAIIFLPCGLYLLLLSFFFFPRLFSAVGNWMSTILLRVVWP